MKLGDFLISKIFPGTVEEYHQSKKIHRAELKHYRTHKQYILGVLLFSGPLAYLLLTSHSWIVRGLLLAVFLGSMLIRDTITEHFCLKINREHGPLVEEVKELAKRPNLFRIFLITPAYGLFLGASLILLRVLFHFPDTPEANSIIGVLGIFMGLIVFNNLADKGKMNWFFKHK